jgi:hypothetical protein
MACYPDNVTALQALLSSDAVKYRQGPNTILGHHLDTNNA